ARPEVKGLRLAPGTPRPLLKARPLFALVKKLERTEGLLKPRPLVKARPLLTSKPRFDSPLVVAVVVPGGKRNRLLRPGLIPPVAKVPALALAVCWIVKVRNGLPVRTRWAGGVLNSPVAMLGSKTCAAGWNRWENGRLLAKACVKAGGENVANPATW